MKKRIVSILLIIVFACAFVVSVSALDSYVTDEYGMFTDSEIQEFTSKCESIKDTYGVTPYIVILNSMGTDDIDSYAREYMHTNGFDPKCTVFMVSMEERKVGVYASDAIASSISTEQTQDIYKSLWGYLHDSDYYNATLTYLNGVEFHLNPENAGAYMYNEETYGDGSWESNEPAKVFSFFWIIASLVIGFGIAFIIASYHKGKLKSVTFKADANDYMQSDSMHLTQQSDNFLYFTVTKVAKPKDKDKGSGSSFGGMSSSSGGGFSGSSGSF